METASLYEWTRPAHAHDSCGADAGARALTEARPLHAAEYAAPLCASSALSAEQQPKCPSAVKPVLSGTQLRPGREPRAQESTGRSSSSINTGLSFWNPTAQVYFGLFFGAFLNFVSR